MYSAPFLHWTQLDDQVTTFILHNPPKCTIQGDIWGSCKSWLAEPFLRWNGTYYVSSRSWVEVWPRPNIKVWWCQWHMRQQPAKSSSPLHMTAMLHPYRWQQTLTSREWNAHKLVRRMQVHRTFARRQTAAARLPPALSPAIATFLGLHPSLAACCTA